MQEEQEQIGIDWDGSLPPNGENIVHVDPPILPLSNSEYEELVSNINPVESTCDYGIELYTETVQFVMS